MNTYQRVDEGDVWSFDGESIIRILDAHGVLVRRGDIRIEQTGGMGSNKEWWHSWRAFEMPKLDDGHGYAYENGRRIRFSWIDPRRSVLVSDPEFTGWYRKERSAKHDLYSRLQEGKAEDILRQAKWKWWQLS